MPKTFSLFAAIFLILSSSVVYAQSRVEATAECRQYAREDGIQSDELKEYMDECIKDYIDDVSGAEEPVDETQDDEPSRDVD
jgi:hypothetical protein